MNRVKEWLLRVGLATAAALTAGPPILHFEDTQRAVDALTGQDVRCDDEAATADSAYPYDAIVVPGAGRWFSPEGAYKPTLYGEIRLEAAAIMYIDEVVDGRTPSVVLLNGASDPEEDPLTEVRYLEDKVQELTGGDPVMPREAIIWEGESVNTATNMRMLASIAQKHGLSKVVIGTNRFHLDRAMLYACAYGERIGLSVSGLAAEAVIAGKYPHRADELAALYETDHMNAIRVKEAAEIMLFPYDPYGHIPTWVRGFLDS